MQRTPKSPAVERERRRRLVVEWVGAGRVKSQIDLQRMLADEGIEVNQATLSRDVRDMGLVKGPDGYALPAGADHVNDGGATGLYAAVRAWLSQASAAGQLVVLRTPPGGATGLALALDRANWKEILGTVAGDDTIFLATRSPSEAQRCTRRLLSLREHRA